AHQAGQRRLRFRFPRARFRPGRRRAEHLLMAELNPTTRDQLTRVSTATLTTALFKRGLRNQFLQGVSPVAPKGRNMVGPAFTLRYIPAREDLNPLSVFQNPQHPQRHAIETCPEGHVMVIDSRKDARAASAGAILVTRSEERRVGEERGIKGETRTEDK